ncbi:single-stranded DNA-binding protein [Demequina litorisediminis]|uniref:Uncharacterized protein n=1 Tax=Demequina litorisediminis TaxID=1849022 RepID=A0ABQ6IKC2_9MICO|nr:single-stranded DNA-binding protein [Demequina litorisediminis]GMA37798.1 hypothetical protein GCM10025876_40020 [Demequina litorisediminis]GMA37857.1 hypothetical protein GCM10025876_40610 [Demequina litorisediminis]GMA37881.1 hypothetical protein GCM10025876_40850 [Demequina litorisediminis]
MNTFTVPTEGTFPIMGWVATAPVLDDDTVTFDLVVTPRIKNASDDGWTPAPAEWFTVNAYDSLAFHLAQSVRVGEPLLVFGSVGSPSPASGTQRTRHRLHATAAGHNLAIGPAMFGAGRDELVDHDTYDVTPV